jgi:peptide/nickel transport system permease protein
VSSRWINLTPLAALAIASIGGSLLSQEVPGRLNPAMAWCRPSWGQPLGCGEAGVDLWSLVATAEGGALALAAAVGLFGFVVGTGLGAGAALARGSLERIVERTCDLAQSFPTFVMAIAVLSAVRVPSRLHIGCVFALTAWAPFARLALAQTRSLRSAAFIEAAAALGRGPLGILARHIAPNLVGVAAVQLGSTAAAVVVGEASLAFVGLGPSNGVSLGAVLDQGASGMLRAPHVLIAGASAVLATSASLLVAGRVFQLGPRR